jgi:endonuclease-3
LADRANRDRVIRIIGILRKATKGMPVPAAVAIREEYGKDPFLMLISCLLSLRAKDTASLPASQALFKRARTPQELSALPLREIEQTIYSVGFYRSKARRLKTVCQELIDRFKGKVPDTYQELISIKGVGPKTAHLVLGESFDKQELYVDIHVHRVSNRLGLIKTKKPEESQIELERIIPKEYWNEYCRLIVTWGQNICGPISPLCSGCPLYKECKRVDVTRSR